MLDANHSIVLLQDRHTFPLDVLVQYRAEFPIQFPFSFVVQEHLIGHAEILWFSISSTHENSFACPPPKLHGPHGMSST